MITKSSNFNEFCLKKYSKSYPTILILDSGVGGLSIYNEIRKLLPNFHYIYAFDNISSPYGEKNEKFIINRVLEITTAIQQKYPSLALVVIACNTASVFSLPVLRKKFFFPVVGVVPAIKPAVRLTKNGIIGLLATNRTINSSYTRNLIARFAKKCKVEMLSSTELVRIVEAKLSGELILLKDIYRILRPWLNMSNKPDTIVLGCTHFPFLKEELIIVLPNNTNFVDSGTAIARRVLQLMKNKLQNKKSTNLNCAFCMLLTTKTIRLLPILRYYGFTSLKELTL